MNQTSGCWLAQECMQRPFLLTNRSEADFSPTFYNTGILHAHTHVSVLSCCNIKAWSYPKGKNVASNEFLKCGHPVEVQSIFCVSKCSMN